eukprot:s3428_g5.t1
MYSHKMGIAKEVAKEKLQGQRGFCQPVLSPVRTRIAAITNHETEEEYKKMRDKLGIVLKPHERHVTGENLEKLAIRSG